MLSREELFSRLASVVPGAQADSDGASATELDIYFEPLSMSGLEEMHRYSIDPRLYEFFEFDPFDTIEKTRAYIEKLEQRMSGDPLNKTSMYWFVRRKSDSYLIGTATLVYLNYDRQSIEWGYGVDPELWGHGYILQIEEVLKYYVFEVLQLNRLYGTTMTTNERAITSLLSTGMKYEGTLRQYYCKQGVYVDGWHYAMLHQDYLSSKTQAVNSTQPCSVGDVIAIIRSVLTEAEITPESTMKTIQSWDSLSHMSIMIAISTKLGIKLSPAQITSATSVKAISDLVAFGRTEK